MSARRPVRARRRIEKTLELAHIKLGTVVTDILGKTGRAILEALSAGRDAPEQLAGPGAGLRLDPIDTTASVGTGSHGDGAPVSSARVTDDDDLCGVLRGILVSAPSN